MRSDFSRSWRDAAPPATRGWWWEGWTEGRWEEGTPAERASEKPLRRRVAAVLSVRSCSSIGPSIWSRHCAQSSLMSLSSMRATGSSTVSCACPPPTPTPPPPTSPPPPPPRRRPPRRRCARRCAPTSPCTIRQASLRFRPCVTLHLSPCITPRVCSNLNDQLRSMNFGDVGPLLHKLARAVGEGYEKASLTQVSHKPHTPTFPQ